MTGVRPAPYSRRVSRGARLLDARFPGWWKHVNTRTLDMSAVRDCVLGQLMRSGVVVPPRRITSFRDVWEAIGIGRDTGHSFGFDAYTASGSKRLDSLWRQEINRRASDQDGGRGTAGS